MAFDEAVAVRTSRPGLVALAAALTMLAGSGCNEAGGIRRPQNDKDGDEVVKAQAYYDGDDGEVRAHGRPASTAVRRQVTALVKRYYEAAAASDGARACSLTYSLRAEAIVEEDVEVLAPAYIRGVKTCSAAMSLLFAHMPRRPAGVVEVMSVRVDGRTGEALVGSSSMPASVLPLRRELGVWKIDGLIGTRLP